MGRLIFIIISILTLLFHSCASEEKNTKAKTVLPDTSKVILKKDSLEELLSKEETLVPDYQYPMKPSKDDWQEDIGEVFVMLPDSVFRGDNLIEYFLSMLTLEKRRSIALHKKTILTHSFDCFLRLSKNCNSDAINCIDRDNKYLAIEFSSENNNTDCILDGAVDFQLNGWHKNNGTFLFTIIRSSTQFDFKKSHINILIPHDRGWEDVTNELLNFTLYDFIDQSYFKEDNIKAIDEDVLQKLIDNPPLYSNVKLNDTLTLILSYDILASEFDSFNEGKRKPITDYIKYKYVNLIWNGETFEKQFRKFVD